MSKQQLHDIVTPHEHDVLSGRGNFVNYHAGNEHFRALVRKHKVAYVACPKPQKGKFSRLIVDEIRARNPPGRFLKQDPNTKLWHDIGEKKALDKTRQALREGAPEISKELTGEGPGAHGDQSVLKNAGGAGMYGMGDGVGGYGAPDLKNEFDDPQQLSQHATLNMMQQQHRMQQPQQQQQLSRAQMMGGAQGHPGQLYAGQIQRMQQQQQQHMAQQQQKLQQQQRLQQQQLSRHLAAGGQLGNQLSGGQLGGMGGLGGMGNAGMGAGMGGGMGGRGLNPYANFQNDYEDNLEPTPFSYNQLANNNAQLQAQLQAQAQLQVAQSQQQQRQQLQQLQQRQQAHHQQQQNQLRNQAAAQQSLASQVCSSGSSGKSSGGAAHTSAEIITSTLKDEPETKSRPNYPRENSEQSLNLGSAFEDTIEHGLLDSGNGGKEKQKMGGSSAHMSFMSLTVSELDGAEDVGVAGDLSSMFDSSLQISDNKRASAASTGSSLTVDSRRKSADESKAGLLDMSVATIGDGMSTVGGLSSALGADIDDSQAHMSFSHMFDDSEKNNV